MKASLPNAFAAVRLGSILEFHLSRPGTGGPDRPYSPYVPQLEEPTKSSRCPLPLSRVLSFVGEVRPPRSPRFFPGNPIRPSVRLATGGEIGSHGPQGGAVPRGAAPSAEPERSTTSFLTAATLTYAIGAGITAAAGTRLALRSFLVRWFESYSFRTRHP